MYRSIIGKHCNHSGTTVLLRRGITMKGKSPSASATRSVSEGSPLMNLQNLLKTWQENHEKCVVIVKEVIEYENELTYVTAARLEDVSEHMRPSRISHEVLQGLESKCFELSEIQQKMLKIIEDIKIVAIETEIPVNGEYLEGVVHQLTQQLLLEMTISNDLLNKNIYGTTDSSLKNIDQYNVTGSSARYDSDTFVTILACYTYCPYYKPSEVQMILDL